MSMALMEMMLSWVYAYLQTHHEVVYIKYAQIFTGQSYINKAFF